MVRKIKIEIPQRYGKRKDIPQARETRQQYEARKMNELFKKYNKADPQQKKLEEALKNKDFTLYNDLRTKGVANAEEITIRNSIQAMQLMKSKLQSIIDEVYSYNPNVKEVDEIEKGAELLIETIEKQIKFLLFLLPKVGKLSKEDQNKLDVVARDVERYSVELNKIDGLLKILQTKENKLDPKLVEQLKKRKKIKAEEEDLKKDVSEVFRFGLDTTKIEQDKLRKALEDPLKRDIITEDVRKRADTYQDNLTSLKIQYTTLNQIFNKINDSRAEVVTANGANAVNTFNAQYYSMTDAVNKLEDFILKPTITSIGDIERYMSLDTKELGKLETSIEQVIKDGNKLLKKSKNLDKVPRVKVKDANFEKVIDDDINTMKDLIKAIQNAYVMISDVFIALKDYPGVKSGNIKLDLINEFEANGLSVNTINGKKILYKKKYSNLLNAYNDYTRELLQEFKQVENKMRQYKSDIKMSKDSGLLEDVKDDIVDYYQEFNKNYIHMAENLVESLQLIVKDPFIIKSLDKAKKGKKSKKGHAMMSPIDKLLDEFDVLPKPSKLQPIPVNLTPEQKKDIEEKETFISNLDSMKKEMKDDLKKLTSKSVTPSKSVKKRIKRLTSDIDNIRSDIINQKVELEKMLTSPSQAQPIAFNLATLPLTYKKLNKMVDKVKKKIVDNGDYIDDLNQLEDIKIELAKKRTKVIKDAGNKKITTEEAQDQVLDIDDQINLIEGVEQLANDNENQDIFATPPMTPLPGRQSLTSQYFGQTGEKPQSKKKKKKKN